MNLLTVLPHLYVTNAMDMQGYDLSFIVTAKMKTLIFFTDVPLNLLDNIVMRNYMGIICMIVGTQMAFMHLLSQKKVGIDLLNIIAIPSFIRRDV